MNYDEEPVEYCESCLDLKIKGMDYMDKQGNKKQVPYCGNCGSADVSRIHIDDWRERYYDRYGHDFIKRNK